VHEETGLLVPPRSADHLAGAIARLLSDGEARSRFGRMGPKALREVFGLRVHVQLVLEEIPASGCDPREDSRSS